MKKLLVLMSILLLETTAVSLFAQKAGDIISGVVFDDDGPMMMVNVTERDSKDRIMAHAITDMEGNFSFRLVDPNDRLKITYVGYETVDIPIDKLYFGIKMKNMPMVETVVHPRDRKIIGANTSRMKQLQEYAPEGYVCGYVITNGWDKVLWSLFLVNAEGKYSLKYKKGDATETRSIESYLAKDLESAVNKHISDIDYAVNNPDTVLVPSGIPLVDMIYDGDIAYAITPDKAVSCWTWYEWPEKMPDGVWKQESLKFIHTK